MAVQCGPYLWAARIHVKLDVGQFSRSTTIDLVDVVPQLHFAFAAHFEATVQKWTVFGDLLYVSMGQSETQNGISVSTNLQRGSTARRPDLAPAVPLLHRQA